MWFVTVLAIASAIFSAALFFAPLIIAWLHPLLDKVPLGGRGNSLVHYIFDIPFVFAVHIYESIQRTSTRLRLGPNSEGQVHLLFFATFCFSFGFLCVSTWLGVRVVTHPWVSRKQN